MKRQGKKLRQDNAAWEELYASGSSRYANEGDIGIYYRLPKFVQMFRRYFSSIDNLKILEVGGGVGEMYDNLAAAFQGESFHYTVTEYSLNATKALLKKYAGNPSVTVVQADAQALPFEDHAFDMVLAFDVMHHVKNPGRIREEWHRN